MRATSNDTLILASIPTGGVVLSTLRDAADRDDGVYVLEDGSSDHDRDLGGLLMGRGFPLPAGVISIAERSNLLGAAQ